MYVIVAYHPHRPPAVYGPLEDRHPPTTPEPPHSIVIRVPLHPITTRLGTTPANPATPPSGWPRTVHTSRRLAGAITTASPPPGNATPVVILLASPTSGLLTAIGPFTTTTDATTWLDEFGRPGGDISAAVFPLHTPPARPSWTVPDRRGDRSGAAPGRQAKSATAPQAAPIFDLAASGHRQRVAAEPDRTAAEDGTPTDHNSNPLRGGR